MTDTYFSFTKLRRLPFHFQRHFFTFLTSLFLNWRDECPKWKACRRMYQKWRRFQFGRLSLSQNGSPSLWNTRRSLSLRFLRADTVGVEIKTNEKETTIDRRDVGTTLTIGFKPLVLSKWKRKSDLPLSLRRRAHAWTDLNARFFPNYSRF